MEERGVSAYIAKKLLINAEFLDIWNLKKPQIIAYIDNLPRVIDGSEKYSDISDTLKGEYCGR